MARKPLSTTERVDIRYEWGRRLEAARVARDMNRHQLARAAGVALTSLRRFEEGGLRPAPEAQASIAAALEYPVYELFPRDDVEAKAGS